MVHSRNTTNGQIVLGQVALLYLVPKYGVERTKKSRKQCSRNAQIEREKLLTTKTPRRSQRIEYGNEGPGATSQGRRLPGTRVPRA